MRIINQKVLEYRGDANGENRRRGRVAGMLVVSAFLFAATGARAQISTYHVDGVNGDDIQDDLPGLAKKTSGRCGRRRTMILCWSPTALTTPAARSRRYASNRVCITKAITVRSVNGRRLPLSKSA